MVVWKWQKTDHQPFSGDFVGKRQKFLPFSNNHNQLFENGRKQTINNFVRTLLENGRNFGRFPITGVRLFSNNPKCFGRFPTKRFRPFSYNFFRPFSTSPPFWRHHSFFKQWGCNSILRTSSGSNSSKYCAIIKQVAPFHNFLKPYLRIIAKMISEDHRTQCSVLSFWHRLRLFWLRNLKIYAYLSVYTLWTEWTLITDRI